MTSIILNTKSFFQNIANGWTTFKDRYCPDGQTCNDIATIGGLLFTVWFMYIAMEPILRQNQTEYTITIKHEYRKDILPSFRVRRCGPFFLAKICINNTL